MGRVYQLLARLSLLLFFVAPCQGQNGQGSQNNILGNNTPFGNVNFNNGYVIVNGTKRFGPDMGANYFQQALNSLAQPANQYSGGGGNLDVYGFNFVPSTLFYTNKWNGSIHLHGAGVASSGIIGPAPIFRCTGFGGGYSDNDSEGRFVVELDGMCLAGITNAVTNIIEIHNCGALRIHDNWIGCWTYMTNHFVQATSPGFFLPFSGPVGGNQIPNYPLDLVGINLSANFVDYQYIEHNSFLLIACALDIVGYDHVRFDYNFMSQVGAPADSSQVTQLSVNNWPATNAESLGAQVIVRGAQSNGDFHAFNNYFYIGGWCYAFFANPANWRNCIIENDTTENVCGYVLTDGIARVQAVNSPVLHTFFAGGIATVFLTPAECGTFSTNQFWITQTAFLTNFLPVKKFNLQSSLPTLSEGLSIGNGSVSFITQDSFPGLSNNTWISSPVTLSSGVDPAMNGSWTFKGFDATLGVHTWTNPPNANYILWANTNNTTYNPGVPGTLSQLILSTNIAGFTNSANWISTYTFNDSLGYNNQKFFNGFSNWVQVAYNTIGGTLASPPFMSAVTWTNSIVPGMATTSTNTIAVSATGVTNSGTINYLLTITAGTGMALKDSNGNQFATPVLGDTVPLKPGWRFTGTGVTAQAFAQ